MPNVSAKDTSRERERERGHVRRQSAVRDQFLQFFYRLWIKILVRIKPQHPRALDLDMIQRPVELLGLIPRPIMPHTRRAMFNRNLMRAITFLRFDNNNLPRVQIPQFIKATPNVQLFVASQDDYSQICLLHD